MENRLQHALDRAGELSLQRKAKKERPGLYLFECEGYVKVGIAVDPTRRLVAAQVGNPFEVRLVAFRLMADARDQERLIHHKLANEGCHVRGEWFKLPPHLMAWLLAKLTAQP